MRKDVFMMPRSLPTIAIRLGILLCLGSTPLAAIVYSNQTFLKPRSPGREMTIEQATWYQIQRDVDNATDRTKAAAIQLIAFYQRSYEETDIGRYFGLNKKYSFLYNRTPATGAFPDLATEDLLHTTDSVTGELTIKPKRIVEGFRISGYKSFNDGYFCSANLPILRVKTDLHVRTENESSPTGARLLDILGGLYSAGTHPYAQTKLSHSKISAVQLKTDVGLGDIDLVFGRRFIDEETFDASGYLKLTLPASNEPTGEYLFEPLRGNGKHWEFGAGATSSLDLWCDKDSNVEMLIQLETAYIFHADEKRTFNAVTDIKVVTPWSRYMVVGTNGQTGTEPLANFSTIPAKVSPGFRFEGIANLGYRHANATFDVGYNFYAHEGEIVEPKNWNDDRHGFVKAHSAGSADGYPTGEPYNPNSSGHPLGGIDRGYIQVDELDTTTAATPAAITHSISLSAGYLPDAKHSPMLVLGGTIEYSRLNSSITSLTMWFKGGLTF